MSEVKHEETGSATPHPPKPSTKHLSEKSAPQWVRNIGIGLGILMVIISIWSVVVLFRSGNNKSSAKAEVTTKVSETFTKEYTLKKDDGLIRVKIPFGYTCVCSSGGTTENPIKYYHQNQNQKPEVWGDGIKHFGGGGAYFDLWYYDQEITVVCTFSKDRKK